MSNNIGSLNKKISIIIPALNEAHGIEHTISIVPRKELAAMGYDVQIMVVDNDSDDETANIAKRAGAEVVHESQRGYGSAYKAGFKNAKGEIIVTADADATYPIDDIPRLVTILENERLDFLNTNRLATLRKNTMSLRNQIGNKILSLCVKLFYGLDIRDPESGMWILRKDIIKNLKLDCDTWPFSHELKLEVCFYGKYRWKEVPIEYRSRVGKTKLLAWKVGFIDLLHIIMKRISR